MIYQIFRLNKIPSFSKYCNYQNIMYTNKNDSNQNKTKMKNHYEL